ncbi:MAG: hypothetical protein H6713_38450 [Myxococcales bacterium]|nr:hypothetical protein [Myxococcales bacterium]
MRALILRRVDALRRASASRSEPSRWRRARSSASFLLEVVERDPALRPPTLGELAELRDLCLVRSVTDRLGRARALPRRVRATLVERPRKMF